MNRIDNKVAVVTGGTQGIGAAIALLFARAGAAGIVIVGRDMDKGRKVADEIETNSGLPVLVIAADLARMDNVRRVMAETDARFGRVDILVNAAGLTDRGNHLNTSTECSPSTFRATIVPKSRSPSPGTVKVVLLMTASRKLFAARSRSSITLRRTSFAWTWQMRRWWRSTIRRASPPANARCPPSSGSAGA